MEALFVEAALLVWPFTALVGLLIGRFRGRAGFGAVMGLLGGPLGWLVVLCMSDRRQRCAECRGVVERAARRCRHCGEPLAVASDNPFARRVIALILLLLAGLLGYRFVLPSLRNPALNRKDGQHLVASPRTKEETEAKSSAGESWFDTDAQRFSAPESTEASAKLAERPRRLADLPKSVLAGRKMKQEGHAKSYAIEPSFGVQRAEFKTYDAAMFVVIQKRWHGLLDSNEFARDRTGKVVLDFHLNHDGRVTQMRVAENTVGEILSMICQRAVLDPSPFGKWPRDMRRMVGNTYREVRFTFYFN